MASAKGGQASTSGSQTHGISRRRQAAIGGGQHGRDGDAADEHPGQIRQSAKKGSTNGGYRKGWVAPGGEVNALAR